MRKDQEIQLVKRRNCHIMAKEKGCDSHCIRSYNKNVWEAYWKPWNWDQNWTCLETALSGTARIIWKVLSCEVPRKGYCCENFDICFDSGSKTQRYHDLSVKDNIKHNNNKGLLIFLDIIVMFFTLHNCTPLSNVPSQTTNTLRLVGCLGQSSSRPMGLS